MTSTEIVVPKDEIRLSALELALARFLLVLLTDEELRGLHLLSRPIEQDGSLGFPLRETGKLVSFWREEGRLAHLVVHAKELRPQAWRDQIWPLVCPRFELPTANGRFVGRHTECAKALRVLCQSSPKVVVVRGPSGIGKTRFALEVARLCAWRGRFDDIHWLTMRGKDLNYRDVADSWMAWLRFLNSSELWGIDELFADDTVSTDRDPLAAYLHRVLNSKWLICIDGLETPDGHEPLMRLLAESTAQTSCSFLISTTSDIRIPNEVELGLYPWTESEAVTWFRWAGLRWDVPWLVEADERELRRRGRLAGGIPLAAKWQVAQASQQEMPETDLLHLQELPSERLLEKVFGASFERLPDDSQHLLMALALFDAPATREAWQATARVPAQGFDFGIEGLKNWMLIEHDTVNDRYDLLAITKEFALKRLRDQSTDIAADLQRNRLNYYTEFTGVNGRNRRNHEKLVADWANVWQTVLVTTKQWEVASGSWPLSPDAHGVGNSIIVLANNLDMFCRERGYHQERLHLCKNAAKAADLLGLEEHLGPLAYSVGWILCDTQPDLRAAEDWAKWALGALERIGRGTGYALRLLARIERSRLASRLDKTMPEHERVNSYLSRATIAFMNDMDARGLARVYSDWGLFLFRTDEFRESLRKHRQALEMFEQEDDEAGIAHTQVNLGDVYVKMGQFDTAWPYYLRALDISRTSLLTQTAAESEHGLARVLLGKWSQSRDFQRRENLESARSRALAARDMFVKLAMHRELASVDLTIECIDSALAEQLKPVTERSDTMRSADADAYADLEIFVTKDGEVFVHSFQGERLGTISSDMLEEIKMVMDLIDEDRTSAQSLRNFGTNLYRMLFSLNVHTHFNQTEAAARVKGQGLRIRLTVEAGALSEIPWEFLFRQEGSYFLAADENMVLSHYVRIPQQLAPIAPDAGSLRMLLIVANPSDQVPLNPDDWDARVRKKLKEPIAQNKIAIETVKHATRQNIATAVMTHKPNIVQFVGHGVYDGNMGFLLLVNENTGKSWRVSDDTFRNMFRSVRTQLGLVSLVSCETAQGTPLRGFLGVAPKLVEMGVPAVVAMRYPISIAAAEVFLEEFYRAIADLRPVDWATQWARNQIGIAFGFDNREFATPVLFMRAKDGRIFA